MPMFIIGCIAVVATLVLIVFPETRTWLKGVTKLFIRDRLSTPEGAEAFYTEVIDQKTDEYNEAQETCAKIGANYSRCGAEVDRLKKEILQRQRNIEAFVAKGDDANAELENEYWCELTEELEVRMKDLEDLAQLGSSATEAMCLLEKQVKDLEKEKVRVVNDLRSKKQIADSYKSLNEIKSTANDKALAAIREKAKETAALAEGERMIYNSRTSVKLEKAEREAKRSSGGYLGQLKSKGTQRALTSNGVPVSTILTQTTKTKAKA